MTKFNYENKDYLDKLSQLEGSYYSKYISFIKKYLKDRDAKFLDVGCGNGRVLALLKSEGYKNGYGADISKLFVKDAQSRGVNAKPYDGRKLPFKDDFFDLIGSFNVVEHTENPDLFLRDQIKKLKKGGHLIVACPNFLSVLFRSPHRRLGGYRNKLRNSVEIVKKFISPGSEFEMMPPVKNKIFEYDDDAIVVTNLIDLERTISENGCRVVYDSGFINYDALLFRLINMTPLLKYLLPSCFVVAQKK